MIDEIAKIRGVELHAAADRELAMLALRPLSDAFGAVHNHFFLMPALPPQ
jgi:hypothetical protein